MPIEIFTLVIKATIVENSDFNDGATDSHEVSIPIDEIINECVTQVLEILKENAQR